MPKQWVVITIGLNPLPCLVEAHRTALTVKRDHGEWPQFLAFTGPVSGGEVREEAKQVRRLLESKLRITLDWRSVAIQDPFSPSTILAVARRAIRDSLVKPGNVSVHFPYTGGTKAMSIHALQALQEFEPASLVTSYLSPSHRRLFTDSTSVDFWVEDERREWNLTVEDLAQLHSYRVEPPEPLDPALPTLSRRMISLLTKGEHPGYFRWLGKDWKGAFKGSNDKDVDIQRFQNWPTCSVPFYAGSSLDWRAWVDDLARVPSFGLSGVWTRAHDGGWRIEVSSSRRNYLIPLYKFLDNRALELVAYDTFHQSLPQADVRHSVTCVNANKQPCELDVTAVLGYQLVAASCTLSKNYGQCKRKGFEVIHRARQIGGDNSRAVLFCLLDTAGAIRLQQELADEGDDKASFRVFGEDTLNGIGSGSGVLDARLKKYLQELDWPLTS